MALFCLVAAACQSPRPFAAGPGERDNPLLDLADRGGIVVLPVGNLPADAAKGFAGEMTKALMTHEVPAATEGGNARSYFLLGHVTATAIGRDAVEIRVAWDLMKSSGELRGDAEATWKGGDAEWRGTPGQIYARLAALTAPEIAALVRGRAASATASSLFQRPVFVLPVEGAPPNGKSALEKELERLLRDANLPIARDRAAAGITVAGRVLLAPPQGGSQAIEIRWTVADTRGRELGRMSQSNAVAPGSLARDWILLSKPIAENAATGVIEILDRSNRRPPGPNDADPAPPPEAPTPPRS